MLLMIDNYDSFTCNLVQYLGPLEELTGQLEDILLLVLRESGVLYAPASYFCKHPPRQYNDNEAYRLTEAFISGEGETPREVSGSDGKGKVKAAGRSCPRRSGARGIPGRRSLSKRCLVPDAGTAAPGPGDAGGRGSNSPDIKES